MCVRMGKREKCINEWQPPYNNKYPADPLKDFFSFNIMITICFAIQKKNAKKFILTLKFYKLDGKLSRTY